MVPSSSDLDRLTQRVDQWCSEGRIVGAEILIRQAGEVLVHSAHGWRNRERRQALRTGTIYRARSMVKPMVATLLLQLAEAGRVDIDEPVARYLPSWDNPRSAQVRIRALLSHTAGFEQGTWPRPFQDYPDLRALVDDIGRAGPSHPNDPSHRYSDLGGATIGALVTELSGVPVETLLSQRICEPLGMRDTFFHFDPGAPWIERMASTYRWRPAERRFDRYWDPSMPARVPYFRASGGILCTVSDYARFLEASMHEGRYPGGRLFEAETLHGALRLADQAYYAGFWALAAGGATQGQNPMPPTLGHVGTDGTWCLAVPELDLVALYFTQSRDRDLKASFGLHLGDLFDLPGPTSRTKIPPAQAIEEGLAAAPLELGQRGLHRAVLGSYRLELAKFPIVFSDDRGRISTWLKGDQAHLVPIAGQPRSFALGWYRNGRLAEVWRERDLRVRFVPGDESLPVTGVEIHRGDILLTSGPRLADA